MQDLPFETIGMAADDVRTLENTYTALKARFGVGLPCDVELPVDKFDFFNNNPDISNGGILAITHPSRNCFLAFIRVHIYYNPRRAAGEIVDIYKYQVWGFIKSKKDYGRVLIRRETFEDKILGLVHPVELEFKDDKAFNHKYYVVSNDSDKAMLAMNWNFRNAIMNIKEDDLMIEIVDKMLLIGNNGWLDQEQAINLTETLLNIASNC